MGGDDVRPPIGVCPTSDVVVILAPDFTVKDTWIGLTWEGALELSYMLAGAAIESAQMDGVPHDHIRKSVREAAAAHLGGT